MPLARIANEQRLNMKPGTQRGLNQSHPFDAHKSIFAMFAR
jgi:hypothetical protein